MEFHAKRNQNSQEKIEGKSQRQQLRQIYTYPSLNRKNDGLESAS
jgi:hypothetical protein